MGGPISHNTVSVVGWILLWAPSCGRGLNGRNLGLKYHFSNGIKGRQLLIRLTNLTGSQLKIRRLRLRGLTRLI
jgi:hypothetical protein